MVKTALVYFPLLVWVLTLFTFVRPLSANRRIRIGWGLFLLVCALKFVLFERFGGDAFNPELPVALLWVSNVLYSGLMLLAALAVVARLLRQKGRRLLVLPVLAWALAVRGVWNGLAVPQVREIELAFANLPPALEGYRIVQIADPHVSASARRWRTQAIVERVNALKADLVVCTGDIVDGTVAAEGADVEPFRDLAAVDGVYFVTGNHEYYLDSENWLSQYRAWGFRFLTNDCVFPRPELALGGVPDLAGAALGGAPLPDPAATFAAATNGEFRVLLAHRPSLPDGILPQAAYDLQLSGHTHGGIMPGLNLLVKPLNRGYVRGLYGFGVHTRIYVSSGAGQWAGFPIRFFDDSEIVLFVLRRTGGAS